MEAADRLHAARSGPGAPDPRATPHYLRLTPEEAALADLMDGSRTVARLVAEFARISGRLAPDQVMRVIADLSANRMLVEPQQSGGGPGTPSASTAPGGRPGGGPDERGWLPVRWGRAMSAVAGGRRVTVANIDPLVSALYRLGGRGLFTPAAAGIAVLLSLSGLALFGWTWWQGTEPVFLARGSYWAGAGLLLCLSGLALAVHELGHALGAKHAGRRVPAAGFLFHYGMPSVFVDTSDVWLSGRRGRLLTTLSGVAAGLVMAGLAQVVGLLFPAAAGWAFKLAFVCYVHTFFQLSPLLPLDGSHLLMDWLEVPHLRTRGLVWLRKRLSWPTPARAGAPVRRDPHAADWSRLDQEGRLVALYGIACLLWLPITVALGWRLWTDRAAGLVTGLWHAGWTGQLLVVLVIGALVAPVGYPLLRWCARRLRGLRVLLATRRRAEDVARRRAVVRSSSLGELPPAALDDLAGRASWLRLRADEPIELVGSPPTHVLVVAEGALEARRPGDQTGTVRQRLGPGGLLGLASALGGPHGSLSWRTTAGIADTVLLALPAEAVTAAIGPLPGPAPADRTEAEELFAETPALEALPVEDRMALAMVAAPIDLGPGEPIRLRTRNSSVVIASGVIVLPEGTVLRRGTMIGPVDADLPEPVAFSRSGVRAWSLPPVAQLPTLLGDAVGRLPGLLPAPGSALTAGTHPATAYPPLLSPPYVPPADEDGEDGARVAQGGATAQSTVMAPGAPNGGEPTGSAANGSAPKDRAPNGSALGGTALNGLATTRAAAVPNGLDRADGHPVDRRFERGLRWLISLLAVVAILLTGGSLLSGPAWAEMPAGSALLSGERDGVTATVGGATVRLGAGDRVYVAPGDWVTIGERGKARLTFRGGSAVVLCARSRVAVDELRTTVGTRSVSPSARVTLWGGRLLADTASTRRSFRPLGLTVGSGGHSVVNASSAWYAVSAGQVEVSSGQVRRDAEPQVITSAPLTCGDGVTVPRPVGTPSEDPTPPTTATPSATPTPTASASPAGATPGPTAGQPGRPERTAGPGRATNRPTPAPPPPPSQPTPPGEEPPPVNAAPVLVWVAAPGGTIGQENGPDYCEPGTSTAAVSVLIADDGGAENVTATLSWSGFASGSRELTGGAERTETIGPLPYEADNPGGTITVSVVASDGELTTTLTGGPINVAPCQPPVTPVGDLLRELISPAG